MLTIGHLLTVALLAGTAGVFFQTAYQVYLPALLAADRLAEGNAKVQSSEAAAQVAGPGVGGLLAQLFGAVLALLADAVSFLASALCLAMIRTREHRATESTTRASLRTEIVEGLRFVGRDPFLRLLTVFGATSNIGLIGYQALLVVFLVREIGVSPGAVGGLAAASSLGAVAGSVSATWIGRRFGTARGMLVAELAGAPFGLLIPLASPGPGLSLVVLGGFAVSAGVCAGNVIKGTFRQTYTPHHLLGRVTASMQLVNLGTIPLAALLAGALATTLGIRPTMWIMTGVVVLAALILLADPIGSRRDLPTTPAGRDAGSSAEHRVAT